MQIIAHRINTLEQLQDIPQSYGVELDLRDRLDRLIMQHDPFSDGMDFESFLGRYQHGTMIVNVKSERIEHRALELLNKYKIANFFFLDSSVPMIVSMARGGEHRFAVRFSEYETIETVLKFAGKVDWVWIDCFSQLSVTAQEHERLKNEGFKTCLVSPELQGRPAEIAQYRQKLASAGITLDAVCTKIHNVSLWTE